MAEEVFTPDVVARTGKKPTLHSGLTSSNTFAFPNTGQQLIRVANESTTTAAEVTVTTTQTVDGQSVENRKVTVAKEEVQYFGCYPVAEFGSKITFKLSSTTSVKVEIVTAANA